MAAPVIESISAPSEVAPGETFQVVISAFDPDSLTATLTGQVSDAAGNVSEATLDVRVQDPLAFALEDTDAAGFTISETSTPGTFQVTAP